MEITAAWSLGDLAVRVPGASEVLEAHALDYCCAGQKSLVRACEEAGLPVERVLAELLALPSAPPREVEPREASLAQLVGQVVTLHHAFTRSELARLDRMVEPVLAAHGSTHVELVRVAALFRALSEDLAPHMLKEERILFPFILALEAARSSGRPVPRAHFGSVANPIRAMAQEHEDAGDLLRELRKMTRNYTPPEEACPTFRLFYSGLAGLDRDLVRHVHLESNLLYPRAQALEELR